MFLKDSEKHLEELSSKVWDYSEAWSFQVLRWISEPVDEYNWDNIDFNFSEEYKIDLYLTVAGHAVRQFEEMILRENFTFTIFEILREPFYTIFENQFLHSQ